jgi:hypothetical protein
MLLCEWPGDLTCSPRQEILRLAELAPTQNVVICHCLAGRPAELKAGHGGQHARRVQA